MPVVTVQWWDSDIEQRRRIIARITESVVDVSGCPAEAVTVIVQDVGKDNWGKGGVPASSL